MKQLKYHLTALLAVASFASMASAQLKPHTTVRNYITVDPYGYASGFSTESVDNYDPNPLPHPPKPDVYIGTGSLRASDLKNQTIINYYNVPSPYYYGPSYPAPCPPTPTYGFYPNYAPYPSFNQPAWGPSYPAYTNTPSYCPPAPSYCPPAPYYNGGFGGYGYSSRSTGASVNFNRGGLSVNIGRQSTSTSVNRR